GIRSKRIMGCVINKTGAPYDNYGNIRPEMFAKNKRTVLDGDTLKKKFPIFKNSLFQLFGIIPWNQKLIAPRTIDLQQTLPVSWVNRGEAEIRHIEHISIGMPNIANFDPLLYRFTLIVTVADRENMVLAAAMAEMNNIPLAGLLLTGGIEPSKSIMRLITPALNKGLPVMKTALDTYPCAIRLPHLYYHIHEQDVLRYNEILKHIAEHLDTKKFDQLFNVTYERRISPAAFCYNLIKKAKVLNKTIVLPEGDEPRTLTAAIDCVNKKIARCLLLADAEVVSSLAKAQGLEIPDELQIINPVDIRDNYIDSLVKLRERKGMNAVRAKQLLEDNTVLGTMMLQQGDVDGLVSGALNTTANTILPALQLIKTRPSASLVSSVFFMCLPDQVLVYGDCAINPDPSAEELADIAIQSAESAVAFGIPARVAMISYSTGSSGRGSDVDKVIRATAIVKQQRPDLLIDGPLQYDAAANAEVASKKAPDSPVAGRATVFVFPDLNTGNTTYKAVQRSANVISIGPMLQGLKKPVNDLSRGALVNDIFYTIALTAIQSDQIT
ncbi:MAG: phosphate acetyltransferase, partial [Endozoicomonadaceae bacterium]|nr:phosphate acetyltransferase [Endozoicomonadaceae bacterium]